MALLLFAVPLVAQNWSFDSLASQADAAREHNDVPGAIELYTKALEANPQWADGWWFLGSLQYNQGAYAPASAALSHYIELKPKAAPALALRGLCEFETGDYQQSLTDIEQAISLGAANDPHNTQVLRYHQGLLLTRLGKFEDALRFYSFFAEQKIPNSDLFLAIGLAGLRMPLLPKEVSAEQQPMLMAAGNAAFEFMTGDEEGAHDAFEEFFRRFPTTANAHYLYGYLLFATRPDAAIPEFFHELEIAPTNAAAQVMAAWALLLRNRPAEALPLAEKASTVEPRLPSAQLVLGKSLVDTGDVNGGIAHLEQALKMDPNDLEVHIALVKAYSKSGRKDDARRERMLCLQLTQNGATQIANP